MTSLNSSVIILFSHYNINRFFVLIIDKKGGYFMKFEEASVRINGNEEIIGREDISKKQNFLEVIDNLYCPEPGCEAKLVYNRRSTGLVYLSKHKSYEHDENCPRFGEEEKTIKSTTDFIEMNGGLTEDGIQRRKKSSIQSLFDYLNPPEKEQKKSTDKKKTTKNKSDDQTSTKTIIKVAYDPNSPVVTLDDENDKISVKEPPFYQRFPHELSEKDNGKNLRTSALIKTIKLNDNIDNPSAEISASFEKVQLIFSMPEAFFKDNKRNLNSDQLISYLKTIKKYVEENPETLYLTTMCQSSDINLDNIVLSILEPDFMSFQTKNFKSYDSLFTVVSAISTKAI